MTTTTTQTQVPVIDLSSDTDEATLVAQVAHACSTTGFFQITNHGVSDALRQEFRAACRAYFCDMPDDAIKQAHRRTATNARGFFDDELTKQRLDWKQALDIGVPGSRDWTLDDRDAKNACLDGYNQLPTNDELKGFRDTIVRYFTACEELSDRIARYMVAGMTDTDDEEQEQMVQDLKDHHTSYLRVNYYPVYRSGNDEEEKEEKSCAHDDDQDPSPLGISPHKDAGFL